jgi:(p)ppGpp synthase/HD superfamily hydrolase
MEEKELKKGTLANAIALASRLFEQVFDKSDQPYILHCLEVRRNVMKYEDVDLEIGAVLHDVVEDTHYTLDMLRVEGYSERVVNIVDGLTRRFDIGESYDDFISRILNSQDDIKVKMGDIQHNSLILRLKGIRKKDLDRAVKYNKAYYILKNHLKR